MKPTYVQHLAIEARMAAIVGPDEFDRLFLGIHFGMVDGDVMYVFAQDEQVSAEIEELYSLHLSIIATEILGQKIEHVFVLPHEMNTH